MILDGQLAEPLIGCEQAMGEEFQACPLLQPDRPVFATCHAQDIDALDRPQRNGDPTPQTIGRRIVEKFRAITSQLCPSNRCLGIWSNENNRIDLVVPGCKIMSHPLGWIVQTYGRCRI